MWWSSDGGKATNYAIAWLYDGRATFQILGSASLNKEVDYNTVVSTHRQDHGKNKIMDNIKIVLCRKNSTD